VHEHVHVAMDVRVNADVDEGVDGDVAGHHPGKAAA
jgi:hypothetical protein